MAGILTVALEDPKTQAGTDGRITLTEIGDAVKNGIAGIKSIVDVSVGGPSVSDTMRFDHTSAQGGDTVTLTGSETWGDLFQADDLIEVRGSTSNNGFYRIVSIDAARKVLTLKDELKAFEITTSPVTVAGGIGTLSLDAELSAGGVIDNLSLPGDAKLVIDIFDFGDPFFGHQYTKTGHWYSRARACTSNATTPSRSTATRRAAFRRATR